MVSDIFTRFGYQKWSRISITWRPGGRFHCLGTFKIFLQDQAGQQSPLLNLKWSTQESADLHQSFLFYAVYSHILNFVWGYPRHPSISIKPISVYLHNKFLKISQATADLWFCRFSILCQFWPWTLILNIHHHIFSYLLSFWTTRPNYMKIRLVFLRNCIQKKSVKKKWMK